MVGGGAGLMATLLVRHFFKLGDTVGHRRVGRKEPVIGAASGTALGRLRAGRMTVQGINDEKMRGARVFFSGRVGDASGALVEFVER